MLLGKMGMQLIMPVKKISGAAHQYYGGGDGVIWCEQTLRLIHTKWHHHHHRNIYGRSRFV